VSVPFVLQAVHLAFYPWFYGTFLEEACQESELRHVKIQLWGYTLSGLSEEEQTGFG
jgi:hypothetical protein